MALCLVVLGDETYILLSYDSWGYIVDVQIRFVVDSLMMHIWCMVIFIRIRRSTNLEYTYSLLDDESSYAAIVICIKINYDA